MKANGEVIVCHKRGERALVTSIKGKKKTKINNDYTYFSLKLHILDYTKKKKICKLKFLFR